MVLSCMGNKVHTFNWDDANTRKCEKHGMSIGEIESLFLGNPSIFPDIKHSESETRYIAIGKTMNDRFALVVFTYRTKGNSNFIRPISARYMHNKEVNYYEKYEEQ